MLVKRLGWIFCLDDPLGLRFPPRSTKGPDKATKDAKKDVLREIELHWKLLNQLDAHIERRHRTRNRTRIRKHPKAPSITWRSAQKLDPTIDRTTVRCHLSDARDHASGGKPSISTHRLCSLKHRRKTLWLIVTAIIRDLYDYDARDAVELPPDFKALIRKTGLRPDKVREVLKEAAKYTLGP